MGNPLLNVHHLLTVSELYSAQHITRFMPMRGPIEFTIMHQIHVDRYISSLEMGETVKRWQLNMLMNLVTVQSHCRRMTYLWVAFVLQTSQAAQQLESSVGIGNLITVPSEKVALAMGSWRYSFSLCISVSLLVCSIIVL